MRRTYTRLAIAAGLAASAALFGACAVVPTQVDPYGGYPGHAPATGYGAYESVHGGYSPAYGAQQPYGGYSPGYPYSNYPDVGVGVIVPAPVIVRPAPIVITPGNPRRDRNDGYDRHDRDHRPDRGDQRPDRGAHRDGHDGRQGDGRASSQREPRANVPPAVIHPVPPRARGNPPPREAFVPRDDRGEADPGSHPRQRARDARSGSADVDRP